MRGLFVGRFQPLHDGHISIMESALDQVDELVVVIGSAERSFSSKDPFTAGERLQMIIDASREKGWENRLLPVPVRDVNRFSIWVDHVISYIPPIDVVFTNNTLTRTLFEEKGFDVRSTPLVDRGVLSGVVIRQKMIDGEDWKTLVPEAVAEDIERIDGVSRLRSISGRGDI